MGTIISGGACNRSALKLIITVSYIMLSLCCVVLCCVVLCRFSFVVVKLCCFYLLSYYDSFLRGLFSFSTVKFQERIKDYCSVWKVPMYTIIVLSSTLASVSEYMPFVHMVSFYSSVVETQCNKNNQ